MKPTVGLCLILTAAAAGCTTAPLQHPTPAADLLLPPATTQHIRVGVEFLARETRLRRPGAEVDEYDESSNQPNPVSVDPFILSHPPPTRETMRPPEELQVRWELARDDIRSKNSPIERVTLRFLSELIGDDRKRVHRAIGASLLGTELRLSTDPMSNFLDERDREDHQRALTKNGTRMIKRPLRNALKELPLFNDVEYAIEEFKATNRRYTDQKSRGMGRISVRLRATNNPVELIWIRGGLRVASNMEYGKASYTARLTKRMRFSVRSRYDYTLHDWQLFGDLNYKINDYTTFHALAGNEVNILGGPVSFPGGPQSEEKAKGVLLYFDHQF